jgi:hypothetical protein
MTLKKLLEELENVVTPQQVAEMLKGKTGKKYIKVPVAVIEYEKLDPEDKEIIGAIDNTDYNAQYFIDHPYTVIQAKLKGSQVIPDLYQPNAGKFRTQYKLTSNKNPDVLKVLKMIGVPEHAIQWVQKETIVEMIQVEDVNPELLGKKLKQTWGTQDIDKKDYIVVDKKPYVVEDSNNLPAGYQEV